MVVALRTGHGESQESARRGVHAIVLEFGTVGVKSQSGLILLGIFFGKLVARDLRFDKKIVGHVFIECADHPIAKAE